MHICRVSRVPLTIQEQQVQLLGHNYKTLESILISELSKSVGKVKRPFRQNNKNYTN
jgi:hypothetical protein